MKKSDLRTGMVVELRNKDKYIVLLEEFNSKGGNLLVRNGGWMSLYSFDEDMFHVKYAEGRLFDILSVYKFKYPTPVCFFDGDFSDLICIWNREEDSKKIEKLENLISDLEERLYHTREELNRLKNK